MQSSTVSLENSQCQKLMSLSVLESVIGNHSANVTMVTWSGAETWKFDTNHLILEGRLPDFSIS